MMMRVGLGVEGLVCSATLVMKPAASSAARPRGEDALEAFLGRGKGMGADGRVPRHEADIVPGARIAGPGIAEPDDEAHQLFLSPPPPAFGAGAPGLPVPAAAAPAAGAA